VGEETKWRLAAVASKPFLSNKPPFCFLVRSHGDTEKAKPKAKPEHTEVAEAVGAEPGKALLATDEHR
jgi:hypothetical protein